MKNHCVSLELAKQIKKAGWKKETEFWWVEYQDFEDKDLSIMCCSSERADRLHEQKYVNKIAPAPLSTEILEELSSAILNNDVCPIETYELSISKVLEIYRVKYVGGGIYNERDKSLPNALAKMWIFFGGEKK